MPRSPHRLDVSATTASLEAVRRFVEDEARAAGLADAAVAQVVLAVDEAAANIVKHAYRGEAGHAFRVAVTTTPERLVVRLLHTGVAFDPASYHAPLPIEEAAHQRRRGGLGVHLMHRLMDHVAFQRRGATHEVRLEKRRLG